MHDTTDASGRGLPLVRSSRPRRRSPWLALSEFLAAGARERLRWRRPRHGNAVLLLGGGIKGGHVYGRWPGLGPSKLDQGDFAGTTDYRTVLEILREAMPGEHPLDLPQARCETAGAGDRRLTGEATVEEW